MATAPKLIYGGIDGTGEDNDSDYEKTFLNSNTHNLFRTWERGPKAYRRGPNALDTRGNISTAHQAKEIFEFVKQHWGPYQRGPVHGKAVFLVGYSRGGAGVIEVAKWLKEYSIPVECLILFDPVDRTSGVGGIWNNTPIADTVRNVIHIVRDPAAGSRWSFQNCGTRRESWTKTKGPGPIPFFGTHGAMGGTPWPEPKEGGYIDEGFPDYLTKVTVARDLEASERVKAHVFGEFRRIAQSCLDRMAREGNKAPDFQVTPVVGGSLPPTGAGSGKPPRIHVVVAGDWLSKIALKYYGDAMKYTIIHEANLDLIGSNPDKIKPGQPLVIPYI